MCGVEAIECQPVMATWVHFNFTGLVTWVRQPNDKKFESRRLSVGKTL